MDLDHTASEKTTQEGSLVVRHSFVVRLWREVGQCGWLGSAQHVGSGAEVCITDLDALLTFIEHRIGQVRPAPDTPRRRPEPPAAHLR